MASEVVWRAVTAVEKADREAAMAGNKRQRKPPLQPASPDDSEPDAREAQEVAAEMVERLHPRPDPGVCIVHIAPDLYKMLGRRGFLADD